MVRLQLSTLNSFPATPLFSHSSTLFCNVKTANSNLLNTSRTVRTKTPGVGRAALRSFTSPTSFTSLYVPILFNPFHKDIKTNDL